MAIDPIEQNDDQHHHGNNNSTNDNSSDNSSNHQSMRLNYQKTTSSHHINSLPQVTIDSIYANLRREFKSKPQREKEAICKIRFINCTSRRVVIFWVDFNGYLKEYTTFSKGDFYDVNTFVSHLWLFRTAPGEHHQQVQVLAVPEDSLEYQQSEEDHRASPIMNLPSWPINNIRCHNCRNLSEDQSCPHMNGEAKFSTSDNFEAAPTYVYRCSTKNHKHEHSCRRRNIYLVEPFLSLRERCFVALRNQFKKNSDIFRIELPASLKREYFEFIVLPEETPRKK